jgi:hypothetical protein
VIALKSLVSRFPQLQIDAASAEWRAGRLHVRGLTKFDVSW